MQTQTNTLSQFFEGIGYICYAFAKADGQVMTIETNTFGIHIRNSFSLYTKDLWRHTTEAYFFALDHKLSSDQAYRLGMRAFNDSEEMLLRHRDELIQTVRQICESDLDFSQNERALIVHFISDTYQLRQHLYSKLEPYL